MKLDLLFLNEIKNTNDVRLNSALEALVETSNSSLEWFNLMSEYTELERANEFLNNLYGVYETVDKYGFTKSIECLVGEQLRSAGIEFSVEADTTTETKVDNKEAKRSFLGKVIDAIVGFFKKIGRFFVKIWNWIFGKKQDEVIKAVEQKVEDITAKAKEVKTKEIKDEDIDLPPNASIFFGDNNKIDKAMIANLAAVASEELDKVSKVDPLSTLATPGKDPYEGIDLDEPKEPEVKQLAEKVGNLTAKAYAKKFGIAAVIKLNESYKVSKKITVKSASFIANVSSGLFSGIMTGVKQIKKSYQNLQKTDIPKKINENAENIEKIAEVIKQNPDKAEVTVNSNILTQDQLHKALKASKEYAENTTKVGKEVIKIKRVQDEILKSIDNTIDSMYVIFDQGSHKTKMSVNRWVASSAQ